LLREVLPDGCTLAAAIRTAEQPRRSSEGNAATGSLGRIVRQADLPIIEEASNGRPAAQHIVEGLGSGFF
jgi:hypothetical protein